MVNRKRIFDITKGKCFYCGCNLDFNRFHADHFQAKSNGGKQSKNLVPTCPDCNQCKGKLDVEQFRKKIESMLEDRFEGRILNKYYGIERKDIKFYYEEVTDGNIQNSVNVILDR